MMNLRRSSTLVLAIGGAFLSAAVLLLVPPPGLAQKLIIDAQPGQVIVGGPTDPKKPVEEKLGNQFSAIKLVENPEFQEYISIADDFVKDKNWKNAAKALQEILDSDKDYYAQVKRKDPRTNEDKAHWVSVKYEANNLIGSMPNEGLEVYETQFGQKARELLNEAKTTGKLEKLGEVAQRFMHTKAGMEANDLLATTFLDRGQYFMAALRFERLLSVRPERAKLSDLTLFKATLAYRRAGDVVNADKTWARLQASLKNTGSLKVGQQLVSIDRLKAVLDEIPRPVDLNPFDWTCVAGKANRKKCEMEREK